MMLRILVIGVMTQVSPDPSGAWSRLTFTLIVSLLLDGLFAEIYEQRTLHMEIRDALEKQIPTDRLADTSVAEALVQLRLSDVRFTRTPSGKYEWILKSVMVVTWNRNKSQTRYS